MAAIAAGGATGKTLLSISPSSSSSLFTLSLLRRSRPTTLHPPLHPRVFLGFTPILCYSSVSVAPETGESLHPLRHSLLLERLRTRHLKETVRGSPQSQVKPEAPRSATVDADRRKKKNSEQTSLVASSFEELGLSEEVLGAVRELGISVPTEIQSVGMPAVLRGESLVLGSHTGSGKTLAYMLPLVQLLRHDEELSGMRTKPRRPRAVVLCPTRELTEQVFRVAKSISHHAKFRSIMISGGVRSKPQEDSLNVPVDLVVGTPGRILQHIEEGNLVYGDIKYFVMDEADTMFDKGFGPDIRKFLGPLKKRTDKPGDQGFQTIMVLATMTKAVQSLIDEEFQGIIHLRTSTLHKKVASARHDFIKLSGSENKLESLLQVLEPSLAKGNRVMVFCNTLNSSRAVDHFLTENHIYTVNYHGEVPAEERVENLKKFKSDEGDCPTLVCTDLAARGLDLDVDHVVMFDFPKNSIDYLHRTGRTARMGAKGKVTSLVTKKDLLLADRIDEAMRKNESLESLNEGSVRRDAVKSKQIDRQDKTRSPSLRNKTTDRSPRNRTTPSRFTAIGRKSALASPQKSTTSKHSGKTASIIDRRSALSVSKLGGKSASVNARTASSSKPVSVKARRTGSSSKPVSVKAIRTGSSSKPVSVKARGTASSSKPVSVKARRTSSSSKPFSVKAERTASPSKPRSLSRGSQDPRKNRVGAARTASSKLSVVGFRGRSSMAKKEAVVSGFSQEGMAYIFSNRNVAGAILSKDGYIRLSLELPSQRMIKINCDCLRKL